MTPAERIVAALGNGGKEREIGPECPPSAKIRVKADAASITSSAPSRRCMSAGWTAMTIGGLSTSTAA